MCFGCVFGLKECDSSTIQLQVEMKVGHTKQRIGIGVDGEKTEAFSIAWCVQASKLVSLFLSLSHARWLGRTLAVVFEWSVGKWREKRNENKDQKEAKKNNKMTHTIAKYKWINYDMLCSFVLPFLPSHPLGGHHHRRAIKQCQKKKEN